jgi:hypothetical protein
MGSYLDKPITEKHSEIDAANGLAFGASAMQGWRVEMEDSHTIITAIGESHTYTPYYHVSSYRKCIHALKDSCIHCTKSKGCNESVCGN